MSEKEIKKAKSHLKIEERELLRDNILKLESLWYDHREIADIIWDYKQVVSNIKMRGIQYPISLVKAKKLNEKIENFTLKLEE